MAMDGMTGVSSSPSAGLKAKAQFQRPALKASVSVRPQNAPAEEVAALDGHKSFPYQPACGGSCRCSPCRPCGVLRGLPPGAAPSRTTRSRTRHHRTPAQACDWRRMIIHALNKLWEAPLSIATSQLGCGACLMETIENNQEPQILPGSARPARTSHGYSRRRSDRRSPSSWWLQEIIRRYTYMGMRMCHHVCVHCPDTSSYAGSRHPPIIHLRWSQRTT